MSHQALTDKEELQAYHLAYFQIFRTILKKRGIEPARQKPLLQKLRQFQHARIKNIDDYLDHIPDFARALGVKPDQLGVYIGSNLLKALQMVKDQLEQQKKIAAPAAVTAVKETAATRSILQEVINNFGQAVKAPDRFKPYQMGFLKLDQAGQEIIGRGYYEMQGAKAPATTVTGKSIDPESNPPDSPGLVTDPGETSVPVSVSAPALPVETSILKEILEKFGDAIKTEGKLVVPQFPTSATAISESTTPRSTEATANAKDSSSPVTQVAGLNKETQVQTVPGVEGGSILAEILETFGADLKVSGKLVVDVGVSRGEGSGASNGMPPADTQMAPNQAAVPVQPAFESVDFDFSDYSQITKKIQTFQTSKNAEGYRAWLKSEASAAARSLMGFRNLESRERKGQQLNWPDEYYSLAINVGLQKEQLQDLHKRIQHFDRMQRLINQFVSQVKTKPAPIVQAFKKIWPQVRLIFNDEDDAKGRMSQLKIPLLQISDPEIKQQIKILMEPIFLRLDQL